MPNIIRRPRVRPRPKPQRSPARDPGTHLTYEERCHIYSLSQYSQWSQRAIASTLQLPRSTVQSAIHAMTKTPRKRRAREPIPTAHVRSPALAAATSSSAIYESSAPHIATPTRPDILQPPSYHPPGAASTGPSSATPIPEDHHRQSPQPAPAMAASRWAPINPGIKRSMPTNGLHDRSGNLSTESIDLQHGFNAHKGASVGSSLPPNRPKPAPIEPRFVYESSRIAPACTNTPQAVYCRMDTEELQSRASHHSSLVSCSIPLNARYHTFPSRNPPHQTTLAHQVTAAPTVPLQ
ncbi:hypothetical protein K469DRAFT_716200 [Zopfia rhizophila CBS 207.26]|uniref:Transposase IS30-like HTH domain-containing protein n=1 Tax=Zopfia rhizophila CBS 207.26 TaxID=1314779 RepID=A0A6A6DJ31_9PEZI|nr:hypothetical protein K469DRAFT_716200 [Zopfia rhizophila CBS 207.26]